MLQFGRKVITTDAASIDYNNIIDVLRKAVSEHENNASDCKFLLNYEKGKQPLQREKTIRSDIDIEDIDNVANEITVFKTGYHWGNPITLVQRGSKDSGGEKETEAITLLNECYSDLGIKNKTTELARFVEICGVGYTYIDTNTDDSETDVPFTVDVLDPQNTFVVRSQIYPDKRVMLGVSFSEDENHNKHYTCFTKDARFEIEHWIVINGEPVDPEDEKTWFHAEHSGEKNPLEMIPIVEWIRNHDRMGCFERQIADMDAPNIMESDVCNATDEAVQAIWHTNDVDFPMDEEGNEIKPKNGDWIKTYTSENGKTPFITPLKSVFDYNGTIGAITNKRMLILQKCNVPMRNNTSGGSTGIAMSDASGWSNAEVEASFLQGIQEDAKMREVRIVLKAINKSPLVDANSPLLTLKAKDLTPNIKRQKTYELATKSNFIATLLSHGFDGESVIKTANVFDDPMQVWQDSKEGILKYQETLYAKADNGEGGEGEKATDAGKKLQDTSDQAGNSPNIDKNRA